MTTGFDHKSKKYLEEKRILKRLLVAALITLMAANTITGCSRKPQETSNEKPACCETEEGSTELPECCEKETAEAVTEGQAGCCQ